MGESLSPVSSSSAAARSQQQTPRSPEEPGPRGGPGRQHTSVPCPLHHGTSTLPRSRGTAGQHMGLAQAGDRVLHVHNAEVCRGAMGLAAGRGGQGWEPSPSCTHRPLPTLMDTTHSRTSGVWAPLGSPHPAPCPSRATRSRCPGPRPEFPGTETPHTALGSLCQCHPHTEKCVPGGQKDPPRVPFVPVAFSHDTGHHWKSLAPSSRHPPCRHL